MWQGTASSHQELRVALADGLQEKGNLLQPQGTESGDGKHLAEHGSEFFPQPPGESLTG